MKSNIWFWSNQELIDSKLFHDNRRRSAKAVKRFPLPRNDAMLKIIESTDIIRCPLCVGKYAKISAEDEIIKGLSDAESRIKGNKFLLFILKGCTDTFYFVTQLSKLILEEQF